MRKRLASRGPLLATLVAVSAIIGVWFVAPAHLVPLYDGIGFPDEPYRYVDPPPGVKATKAPTPATATTDAAGGSNPHPFYANSAEVAPQVAVFIAAGTIAVPPGVTKIVLRADPLAPDTEPADARIDGNVYRLRVDGLRADGEADTEASSLAAKPQPQSGTGGSTITMRATSARQPHPEFFYRGGPTAPWRELATARVGNDIYRTDLAGLGDYVLAWKTNGSSRAAGVSASALAIAVPVALILGAIAAIRVRRRRPA